MLNESHSRVDFNNRPCRGRRICHRRSVTQRLFATMEKVKSLISVFLFGTMSPPPSISRICFNRRVVDVPIYNVLDQYWRCPVVKNIAPNREILRRYWGLTITVISCCAFKEWSGTGFSSRHTTAAVIASLR